MSDPLVITGYDPVRLDPFVDSSNALQLKHESNSLADYGQSLEAMHDDLESPEETIRVKIPDFSYGGDGWTITASHEVEGNPVSWSRDDGLAYYAFGAMTDALEVDVTATSDASPPVTKTRTIWIKTKPVNSQPDRP